MPSHYNNSVHKSGRIVIFSLSFQPFSGRFGHFTPDESLWAFPFWCFDIWLRGRCVGWRMIPSQGHPCGPIPSVDHGPQASLLSSWSSSLFKLQIDIDIYLYVGIYMASTLRGKTIHRFLNHFSRYISSCCAVPPFQSPCLLALLLSNDLVYMHLFEVDISYQVPRKDVFSSVRLVCCQTKAFVELACVCMDWALFG